MQRALIQYRDPKNHDLVMEALRKAGRTDLIGFGPKCLIRPYKNEGGHGVGAKKGVAGAKNATRGAKTRGRRPGLGRGGAPPGAVARLAPANTAKAREAAQTRASAAAPRTAGAAAKATEPEGKRPGAS